MNDFPTMGINTRELIDAVEALIGKACRMHSKNKEKMGAVNWGDLSIRDIEYRLSLLRPQDGPHCVVMVEEASPTCAFTKWINDQLDTEKFPNTYVECEW